MQDLVKFLLKIFECRGSRFLIHDLQIWIQMDSFKPFKLYILDDQFTLSYSKS
jgi:hypothetical protein